MAPIGMKKRVMIVDDHVALRQMLARLLPVDGAYEVVGECGNGREAVETCRRCRPEVMILELALPELCGSEVIRRLKTQAASVRVLIFSGTQNQMMITQALQSRPHGFVEKREPLQTLLEALSIVAEGKSYFSRRATQILRMAQPDGLKCDLTPRELEILQLVAESSSSKQIADRLGVARKTVENHRAKIMDKLQVHDVAGLTRYAVSCGMV